MGLVIPQRIALDLDPAHRVFGHSAAARAAPRGWDFLGSTPVPLRVKMRDGIAQAIRAHVAQGGAPLKCCMPMGQGGRTPVERLRFVRELEDFPKLLVSSEHGNVFNRVFHAAHVETGAFSSGQPHGATAAFEQAGLIDEKGWIGVYAVAPFVLLIDRKRLGARSVPESWADLADPLYRGEVVFSGWRREGEREWSSANLFFLLSMLRLLGPDGLRRLVANVPGLMHSAQMPRHAGAPSSLGAVYVLPWSLADLCPRREVTQVVWPREGGLAYPLWLTAQTAHREKVAPLLDYFFAEKTGRWLDHNLYPSLAPGRPARLPPGVRLFWLGWDYLRHASAARDIKQASAIFRDSRIAFEAEGQKCA
jgi:ABC-type Fe3+ transport system substrate-binding protein